MPIHDYRCGSCGAEFERLVRSGDCPICPHCGSADLERLLSAPVAPGRSAAIARAGRRAAAGEGHLSQYSAAERSAALKK